MTNYDAIQAAREFRALAILKKQTEEQMKAIQEQLQAYMTETGCYTVDGCDVRATWSERKQTTFDRAAFDADHPGLYKQYQVTKPGRVFKVA